MTKISRSRDRHTFQKNNYIERQLDRNEEVNSAYLDMFDNILEQERHKFDDEEKCKNNLEYDLLTTDWILGKARASEFYAQNLYAAMCNNEFQKLDVMPILKDQRWSCSWRYAGGIIADMREEGDYIDWYCSGIRHQDDTEQDKYVAEGCITDEIRNDLQRLGWAVAPGGDWENFE